jgi:hypothetical protein
MSSRSAVTRPAQASAARWTAPRSGHLRTARTREPHRPVRVARGDVEVVQDSTFLDQFAGARIDDGRASTKRVSTWPHASCARARCSALRAFSAAWCVRNTTSRDAQPRGTHVPGPGRARLDVTSPPLDSACSSRRDHGATGSKYDVQPDAAQEAARNPVVVSACSRRQRWAGAMPAQKIVWMNGASAEPCANTSSALSRFTSKVNGRPRIRRPAAAHVPLV